MTRRERIAAALLAVLLLAVVYLTLHHTCPPVEACRCQWRIVDGETGEQFIGAGR